MNNIRTGNEDVGGDLVFPRGVLGDASVLARIADTGRMDDETAVSVSVETVLVAAAQVEFDPVFEPGDLGRRETVDGAVEQQLVALFAVRVSDGRRKRRRTRFRLVVASHTKIRRRAGLAVLVASDAHVLARVGPHQIADFQTGDAHRVPARHVFLGIFRFQQRESVAEPFDFRLGTGQQAASQLNSRALGHFHVA